MYEPRRTLVIEIEVQSAMADEKFFAKLIENLQAGEGDVVHFGVSRVVRKVKKTKDVINTGPTRYSWK